MKFVKGVLIGLVVMALAAGLIWQLWLKEQVAFARVATAYSAKMVCSCLHVAGREMDSCRGDFTEDISAISIKANTKIVTNDTAATLTEETVTASVLGGVIQNTARFEPGLGCTLVKP